MKHRTHTIDRNFVLQLDGKTQEVTVRIEYSFTRTSPETPAEVEINGMQFIHEPETAIPVECLSELFDFAHKCIDEVALLGGDDAVQD